jgi:hypothetical protein
VTPHGLVDLASSTSCSICSAVQRYFTVMAECAAASNLRMGAK